MEKLKQIIQDLLMQKATFKQLLRDLGPVLPADELDELLDQILEIDELIEKLKKGLK